MQVNNSFFFCAYTGWSIKMSPTFVPMKIKVDRENELFKYGLFLMNRQTCEVVSMAFKITTKQYS